MGITPNRYELTPSWIMSLVGCLAMLGLALSTVRAEQPRLDAAKLNSVTNRIDKLVAKRVATSASYGIRNQLLITDFGFPIADWRSAEIIQINAFSTNLRSLMFHAVCQKNKLAMRKLFAINELIYGGVFMEIESEYMHRVARQLALDLNFRRIFRQIYRRPPDDLRSITHKRNVIAAFKDGRPQEALRLLPSFARLCRARP